MSVRHVHIVARFAAIGLRQFSLTHANGCHRIDHRQCECFDHRQCECFATVFVRQHGRFEGDGVMVWGGIMGGQKTRHTFIIFRGN